MGIEPTSSAWEAEVLPLNYTRGRTSFYALAPGCQNLFTPARAFRWRHWGKLPDSDASTRTMQITVNGQAREIPEATTADQLLELLGLEGRRLAMEVNEEIVPRSRFEAHALKAGDRVEIVHAIGGG